MTEPPVAALCGLGQRATRDADRVTVCRYRCPFCDPDGPLRESITPGTPAGRWSSGERCMHCGGSGFTDDLGGFGESDVRLADVPPAVMRRPCTDCAYRPGSPERGQDGDDSLAGLPGADSGPFYCHHGLLRIGDGYVSPAMLGSRPIGAFVCAGWYAIAAGAPLPDQAFRDPGGADRREDAPT